MPLPAGDHSMPCPEVSATGTPPATATLQRWRRSVSPWLEENTTSRWPEERSTSSTSKAPGVSSVGFPPSAGMEYRCVQPSPSQGKTMRPPSAHSNWFRAVTSRNTLPAPADARQISRPAPGPEGTPTAATRMDHGSPERWASRTARSPLLGMRMKAMLRPSGDHSGSLSESVPGRG